MKKLIAAFFAVCALAAASAEVKTYDTHYELTVSEDDFDITYYKYDFMEEIAVRRNNALPTTQAFSVDDDRYEERFTLFTDTGTNDDTRKMEYTMTALEYAEKAAGFPLEMDAFVPFADSDVADEFNADFGHTAFVVKPTSTYAQGYRYMQIDFFCKKGQGIVMRTVLTDDATVFTDPADSYFYVFHSFKFKGEDALFW